MTQAESRLSAKIQRRLRLEGWFCFKVHGGETMVAGLPDIIVCAEGWFIGLETKMPDKRHTVSPRQEHVHGQIRAAGGDAWVVTSEDEALEAVRRSLAARARV